MLHGSHHPAQSSCKEAAEVLESLPEKMHGAEIVLPLIPGHLLTLPSLGRYNQWSLKSWDNTIVKVVVNQEMTLGFSISKMGKVKL